MNEIHTDNKETLNNALKRIEELEQSNENLVEQSMILLKRQSELEMQIQKMRNCYNCENWNWKHSKCEKKLKGDCFKQSKWVLRKILSKEYE